MKGSDLATRSSARAADRSANLSITANYGDTRNAGERVEDLKRDTDVFPPPDDLQNVFRFGRIQVTDIDGDSDGDGDFDQFQPFGGPSFAIGDADSPIRLRECSLSSATSSLTTTVPEGLRPARIAHLVLCSGCLQP